MMLLIVLICGFNESSVPRSNPVDAFLPENLREKLGMKTNNDLFANDLYLFEAICQRRHLKEKAKSHYLFQKVMVNLTH